MKNILLLLALAIAFGACQKTALDLGAATDYYPPAKLLEEGVVNKYYKHFEYFDNSKDNYTDIRYIYYKHIGGGVLETITYDATFNFLSIRNYTFIDSQTTIEKEINYYQGDSLQSEISSSSYMRWDTNEPLVYASTIKTPRNVVVLRRSTKSLVGDTTFEHQPVKVFSVNRNVNYIVNGDTTLFTMQGDEFYAQNLGYYGGKIKRNNGIETTELVEQMSYEIFSERANHDKHRIGFIDPNSIIDSDTDFTICNNNSDIKLYYNSFPRGTFGDGKRAMMNNIASSVNHDLLLNESGYLTYRFVVNCNGQAGWFTTEQADLDYVPKQFNPKTVSHLFQVLSTLKNWSPVVLEGQAQDAYFYITFKLNNGEIIEILP